MVGPPWAWSQMIGVLWVEQELGDQSNEGCFYSQVNVSFTIWVWKTSFDMSPDVKIDGLSSAPLNHCLPSSHPRRPHTFARRGNPKMRGAKPPAIIFVWPSPTRVGAAEDEVMGGDDLLGLRNAPPPGLSPRRTSRPLISSPIFS